MTSTRIACYQSSADSSPEVNMQRVESAMREAAAKGAKIFCTQELFRSPYFCRTQDPAQFELAEAIPGPSTERFSALARELGLVCILSLFEEVMPGLSYNSAAVLDADGRYLGCYRKMHIPQDPGFEEKFYFRPGDLGFKAFDTAAGRIGVIICWDQWFPESARLTALQGAEIIFCPTAIGWLPEEKSELGARQLNSWKQVQAGHAIANGVYYAAINRVGTEGDTEFWGNSFILDPAGEALATAGESESLLLADCDPELLKDQRRIWPFFRDRRTDAYSGLREASSS